MYNKYIELKLIFHNDFTLNDILYKCYIYQQIKSNKNVFHVEIYYKTVNS